MSKRGKIDINGLNTAASPENAAESAPTPESPMPEYEPSPRRPREERTDAFDLAAWLLEGLTGLAGEVRHNDLGLPKEFWVHAYAARREALLAARALIDDALKDEPTSPAPRKQRGRVDINFKS